MIKSFCFWVFHNVFIAVYLLWKFLLSLKYGKGKVVTPVKNPLLLKSATKLAQEIREGKLKCQDVVQAYIDRILEVDPLINATVDRCFGDALKKAREVDSLIASGTYSREYLSKKKPLLGVPFTIKIIFMANGLRCTAGFKAFENFVATRDAPAVALLRKAGAILIATTNMPELPSNIGCKNKIHGITCNPYDTKRTSGGSSGGESALVSAGGSVIGLGNDLAGSIRVPAHFTGIFGHKPTRGLVPSDGCFPPERPDKPPSKFKINKYVYAGPMCRYAEDLIIGMKSLSSTSGVSLNFGEEVDFRKLKIYYVKELQIFAALPVHKDIVKAVEKAKSYFENRYKITAEELKLPFVYDGNRCIVSVLHQSVADVEKTLLGGFDLGFSAKIDLLKALIGKSVLCFPTAIVLALAKFPLWYKKENTLYYQKILEGWTKEFDKLLDETTVLLMPTSPIVAPYNSEVTLLHPSTFYTALFNILGLPVTQCPMGFTEQGLPYGIQIVGRANNDPLTIACAVELEKAFGGWKSPGEI